MQSNSTEDASGAVAILGPLGCHEALNEGVKPHISILIISNHTTVRTTALRAVCHQETLLDLGNGYEVCWGETAPDP